MALSTSTEPTQTLSASSTSATSTTAASEKARGGAAFKAGDFDEAAAAFAAALTLDDAPAIGVHTLHNNRAAALAALGRHEDALHAADEALRTGGASFVKAHYRRALALQSLGRHEEAAAACTAGLGAPGGADNEQLATLQQQVAPAASAAPPPTSRPAAAAAAAASAAPKPAPTPEQMAAVAAEAEAWAVREEQRRREATLAAQRARDEAEQRRRAGLDDDLRQRQQQLREQTLGQRRQAGADALAAAEARQQRVAEVTARVYGVNGGVESGGEAVAAKAAAATQAAARVEAWRVKQLPTRQPVAAPRNPADVTRQFALLRKDSAGWFAFLRLIAPDECRALFSPEVPPEILEATAAALAQHAAVESVGWCARWLGGLSRVGRLEMTVMMLDAQVLARLRSMFEALEALAAEVSRGSGGGGGGGGGGGEAALSADERGALDALPKLRAVFGVA